MIEPDLERQFPGIQPDILEIASALQERVLQLFPGAEVTRDRENVGCGFGSSYKDLVFVNSPYRAHVNLGIGNGATLADPHLFNAGKRQSPRHVKIQRMAPVQNPDLEELVGRALEAATERQH